MMYKRLQIRWVSQHILLENQTPLQVDKRRTVLDKTIFDELEPAKPYKSKPNCSYREMNGWSLVCGEANGSCCGRFQYKCFMMAFSAYQYCCLWFIS